MSIYYAEVSSATHNNLLSKPKIDTILWRNDMAADSIFSKSQFFFELYTMNLLQLLQGAIGSIPLTRLVPKNH